MKTPCFELKNEVGACELFVSHLLWKEIVYRIWKPTFHFRKQTQISADSQFGGGGGGGGGGFCLFLPRELMFWGTHSAVLILDTNRAVPSITKL